jgi:hypothetical protein
VRVHVARRPDVDADRRFLAALVGAIELRRLRLLATRRLALASLAAWLQASHHPLPDLLEWALVVTVLGMALVVAAHVLLEYRCRRRVAGPGQLGIVIHEDRPLAREVGAAFWSALALLSLLPSCTLLVHATLPAGLLVPLVRCVLALLAAAAAFEMLRPPGASAPRPRAVAP